jgi:GNAT superfamily N-acetyltransferase
MKTTLSIVFFFASALFFNPLSAQSLLGKWQLVHFDGIEKIRNSPQYHQADLEMRAGMESRIKERLENTMYEFAHPDSLRYTEFVDQVVVQRKASFEVSQEQILSIIEPNQIKKARILALEENRLVIEPIVQGKGLGKWVFERIEETEED